ncbi:hypothetical protein HNP29_004316 [Pseudomonas alcaligenes]|nr:hypothetical protein [Pseudomonas alcaligenes]
MPPELLGLSPEVWTSIASTFIAVLALLYTLWQGWKTQKHNVLMVHPHLDHQHNENNKENYYAFEIRNSGVGPAIVKDAQLYVDDKPIDRADDQVLGAIKALFPILKDDDFGHETVGWNSYITVGQVVPLMTIAVPKGQRASEIREIVEARFYITGKYESIYGESFDFDTRK